MTLLSYDLAIKEALTLFENKTLDFLGLDLPRITGVLQNEYAEVETRDESVDLVFWLENGEILHNEEQTRLTTEDLIRFAHYDLRIYLKYRVQIHTVILSPAHSKRNSPVKIDTGCLQYSVLHQVIESRNADEVLERIHRDIESGKPVNELELIFAPLMESRRSIRELLFETIRLEKLIKDESIRNKIIALTLVVSNKLVEPEILEEIWEEIKMLKILKFAEDKGIEKGRKEGKSEERRELIKKQLSKKFGKIPNDLLDKIRSMDDALLDILSLEILDFQSMEDLNAFIKRMNI